jgi:hypothetical protein
MASRLLELSQLEDDRFEVDMQDLPLIQVIDDATAAVGPGVEGHRPSGRRRSEHLRTPIRCCSADLQQPVG